MNFIIKVVTGEVNHIKTIIIQADEAGSANNKS